MEKDDIKREHIQMVKRYLGTTKKQLIILKVYIKFGESFDDDESAILFVLNKMEELK